MEIEVLLFLHLLYEVGFSDSEDLDTLIGEIIKEPYQCQTWPVQERDSYLVPQPLTACNAFKRESIVFLKVQIKQIQDSKSFHTRIILYYVGTKGKR